MLEHSTGTLWEIPILLATVTGVRGSEVLGISWEDVDLKSGNVFIRRGVQRRPGSKSADRVYEERKAIRGAAFGRGVRGSRGDTRDPSGQGPDGCFAS